MELREIFETGISVLNEDKAKNTVNILASWATAEEENKNKRTYPASLLQREIDKVQKSVEEGSFIGMGDHPGSGQASIESASHIVNKLWMDDNGKCWAEMKILGTEKGKGIQEIIKAGGKLGLSSRSFGTVKNGIVQDDLKLSGIDIVMNPSSFGATFNKENIFESVDFSEKKETKMEMNSKEKIMQTMYSRDATSGRFHGSLEEWKLKNEQFVDIALLETEEGLSYSEAVRKVMGEERGQKVLNKEAKIEEKVEIKDIIFEANIAGIPPKIYAERLNKRIDEQNKNLLNDDNYDEESAILREATAAGINISDPKIRKKTLEIYESQKGGKTELTEKEKLIEKVIKTKQDEMADIDYLVGEKMLAGK